jgi:Mn2+/Fe2+ NRAMP family transporter
MGPGTFLSSAVAGATYGYALLWALALALAFRYVWVNAAAAYVLVTGESLLQGYARLGRWLVWTSLAATVLVRHSSNLYTILLMGNAAHVLLPLPIASSRATWSIGLTVVGVGMMVGGGYPIVERACRAVMLMLGVTLPVAVVHARPDPAALLHGLLVPTVPDSQGFYSAILILAAMIGAQAGSLSNLSYAYLTTEKGWRGPRDLPAQRRDLMFSTACRFAVGLMLQVVAAATLLPLGLRPDDAEHLVRMFSDSMGLTGTIVFGAGLWGICFSSFVGGTMGYALIVRDICRRFVPAFSAGRDSHGMTRPTERDPVYRWAAVFLGLSPLYVVFLGVEPVTLTLVVRSLVVVVIPVLVGALLVIVNNRRLMGVHRPGPVTNGLLVLLVVISVYLTIRNIGQWI